MTQPACMTDREFELWSTANTALSSRAATPCWDCPLTFAQSMRETGCCDGTPGVPDGRPRLTRVIVSLNGRGNRYDNDEDRLTARRLTWRQSKQRARA